MVAGAWETCDLTGPARLEEPGNQAQPLPNPINH